MVMRNLCIISMMAISLLSCKKEHNIDKSSNLEGKIKSIVYYQKGLLLDSIYFQLLYDSTDGWLKSIYTNGQEYIRIEKPSNNKILMMYNTYALWEDNLDGKYWQTVYLSNGKIDKIDLTDSLGNILQPIQEFKLKNNQLDSCINYDHNNVFSDTKIYDFSYSDGNIVSNYYSYLTTLDFIHFFEIKIKGFNTYFPFANEHLMPYQESIIFSNFMYGSKILMSLYVLGLNNINPPFVNKNLVKSLRSEFSTEETNFQYIYNIQNRIKTMKIISDNNTDEINYTFEYY